MLATEMIFAGHAKNVILLFDSVKKRFLISQSFYTILIPLTSMGAQLIPIYLNENHIKTRTNAFFEVGISTK